MTTENQEEAKTLPDDFEWHDVNLPQEMKELCALLRNNYVEGKDVSVRDSEEFLQWALMAPGISPWLLLGVRAKHNHKLCGFISALPLTIIQDFVPPMTPSNLSAPTFPRRTAFINFLCVHKKLRSKRLAPVLIHEIVRRLYATRAQTLFSQVMYTLGNTIIRTDSPHFASHTWYHRFLDVQTLVEAKFCNMPKKLTLKMLNKLPETTNLVPLCESDLPNFVANLRKTLEPFPVRIDFNLEEAKHYFMIREKVVYSFICPDSQDVISFYSQEMETHGIKVRAAVCFYYACLDLSRLSSLVSQALVMAKKLGFHVFNCLDNLHNKRFLQELKFKQGSGSLRFHLGPYTHPPVENVAICVY